MPPNIALVLESSTHYAKGCRTFEKVRIIRLAFSALQCDYRNLAGRLRLVLGELGVQPCLFGEQSISLLTGQHSSVGLVGLGADLDCDLRVSKQVVVPVRVGRCATLGREDKQAIAIGQVHRRCRAALAALSPRGREQKQGPAFPHSTNLALVRTECLDCLAIPIVHISHNSSYLIMKPHFYHMHPTLMMFVVGFSMIALKLF